MLQIPAPLSEARRRPREDEGGSAPTILQGLGAGLGAGRARAAPYKGRAARSRSGRTCVRGARSRPRPALRRPRPRAAREARGGGGDRRRHVRRAAALTARPRVLRHAARGAARPLPVPRGQHAVGGRGQRQRELGLGREALPRARGALRPPGRPAAGRGPAGGGRPGSRGTAGPRAPAAAHSERPRAGPHQQREHGLHGATHAHPHRACRPQALQDRDAAAGLQLHLAPGQRAAGGRGLRRRAAVPLGASLLPPSSCRQPPAPVPGQRERTAQANLHLLPQQPEKAEQGPGQKDGNSELEADQPAWRWPTGGRAGRAPTDPSQDPPRAPSRLGPGQRAARPSPAQPSWSGVDKQMAETVAAAGL